MTQLSKIAPLFGLALALGCSGASQGGAGGPTSTQQKIVNISPLDLGVCFQQAPALPEKINADVLTGLLVAARPLVMECLVDPKNRGPAEETPVTVKTIIANGKTAHSFSGQNLMPAGEQCIRAALDKYLSSAPDWAAKAGAVTVSAEAQYKHVAGAMPTVKMGISEASDVAGVIRLAQGTFCDCYAPFKDAEPSMFKASIDIKSGAAPTVTMSDANDEASKQVAACLQPKVAALPLKTTASELKAPYTFMFVSSSRPEMFTKAAPPLAFAQYELVRNQSLAASVLAMGARSVAAEAYDALIAKFKKDQASVTLELLQNGCGALIKADEAYIATAEKQVDVEQKAVTMLTDFAAKDAVWNPVKEATQGNLDQAKKDLETGKKYKEADLGACPKVK